MSNTNSLCPDALDEAAADLEDNIATINRTIYQEFARCPHGYTPEYVEAFDKLTQLLTAENILSLLKKK